MTGFHMADQPPKSTVRRQIDANLKRVYEDALNEELPDRLAELLKKLREQEKSE